LAQSTPGQPVGVYAGTDKSGLFRGEDFAAIDREAIKNAVLQMLDKFSSNRKKDDPRVGILICYWPAGILTI
jgi:hypothetical protein